MPSADITYSLTRSSAWKLRPGSFFSGLGTDGSPLMSNQESREVGDVSPSAKCPRGSLWGEQCLAGLYRATAALPVTEIKVCCTKQPPQILAVCRDNDRHL
jgi:hypothetical protein